jgi:hypothetical protein
VGLRDRFRRGERSASGAPILRYPEQSANPRLGVPERQFGEERERLYARLWGSCEVVHHEVVRLIPHIDVYVHEPAAGREFFTLVTGGMSDLRMKTPRGAGADVARAELVLYVDEPREEYVDVLRRHARLPHDLGTWFGAFHTISNGDPPEPLFDGSELDTVFLCPPLLEPDRSLHEDVLLDGDPLNLLWLVPVTGAEAALKLERGSDALLALFDEHDHPLVLDPRRSSYV